MPQAIHSEFCCVAVCTVATIIIQLRTVEMVPFVWIIAESVSDPQ
jgi:hypothetical protein